MADAVATGWADRVTLGWRTENETNIVGFNVIHEGVDGQETLNSELILAQASGQATGSAYQFVIAGWCPAQVMRIGYRFILPHGQRSD